MVITAAPSKPPTVAMPSARMAPPATSTANPAQLKANWAPKRARRPALMRAVRAFAHSSMRLLSRAKVVKKAATNSAVPIRAGLPQALWAKA